MIFSNPAPQLHSFADALSFAINSGWTTVSEVCDILGCSDSTVGRWRNEESEPKFSQIILLVKHHQSVQFKLLILGVIAATSGIKMAHIDPNKDFDGNGVVDEFDAAGAMLQASDEQTTAVNQVFKRMRQRRGPCTFSPADALTLDTQIDSIVANLFAAGAIVSSLAAKSLRRGGGR